jgi:RimJ/RimL family protein N-acetyltransferase
MSAFTELRLATERLDLRPLCLSDADALYGIYADPEFMRYWSSEPWTSPVQAVEMIESDRRGLEAGERLRLGIFLRDPERMVGTCSLFHLVAQNRRAEIGYGIKREYWRHGFMHEAVTAVVQYAFSTLHLIRLEADIDPRNTGSARSLEKLGFVREGLLRERWIVGTEISDSAIYGLLAKDWAAKRSQTAAGIELP